MTDNEIIKALECCSSGSYGCENGCPLDKECDSPIRGGEKIMKSALDLINRLQAQNKELAETMHNLTLEKDALFDKAEELKVEVERLKEFIVETRRCDKEIKFEAVKEFAERLIAEYAQGMSWFKSKEVCYVDVQDIRKLLKELVGDDNARNII